MRGLKKSLAVMLSWLVSDHGMMGKRGMKGGIDWNEW